MFKHKGFKAAITITMWFVSSVISIVIASYVLLDKAYLV